MHGNQVCVHVAYGMVTLSVCELCFDYAEYVGYGTVTKFVVYGMVTKYMWVMPYGIVTKYVGYGMVNTYCLVAI